MSDKSSKFRFGPGLLVAAAFIGPGTVVTASKAGAQYGTALLWAVVFACLTTIVFQEIAARVGIATGEGLGQALLRLSDSRAVKSGLCLLVVCAILIGNAAYQTGNILGAAKGVEVFSVEPANAAVEAANAAVEAATSSAAEEGPVEQPWFRPWIVGAIGALAIGLILVNRFALLQAVLTGLVLLMSGLFLLAAFLSLPSYSQIASGLMPQLPAGSQWLVVAVLGTTVVPYNLFLHASLAARQWSDGDKAVAVKHSRWDTIASVLLGGIVTSAILLSASTAFQSQRAAGGETAIKGVGDIAVQLQPAIGDLSRWLFGIGLFAAGLTSAITAPIAAAYAAAGCFGWPNDLGDKRLRAVAMVVVLAGVVCGILFGGSPQQAIALAQVANGLLLPLLAMLLIVIANRKDLLGDFCNSRWLNAVAVVVTVVVVLIAVSNLKKGFGL